MGGFISTAAHGQTFRSPPAKLGDDLVDYYFISDNRRLDIFNHGIKIAVNKNVTRSRKVIKEIKG
jgi:hypothetical protein